MEIEGKKTFNYKEAGAVYKINQMVLVNTEILNQNLEKFKVRETANANKKIKY
jgi:hypothetical protein